MDEANRLYRLGRYRDASQAYRHVLEKHPANPDLLNRLTEIELRLDRFESALALARRSLALRPHDSGMLLFVARALAGAGQDEEASRTFEEAIRRYPTNAQAHDWQGTHLKELGRIDEAMASYTSAIAADPLYAQAHLNRGSLHRDLHDFAPALADFESALAVRPGFPEANFAKAELLLLTGDYAQGWRLYEERWRTSFRKGGVGPGLQGIALWLGNAPVVGKTVLIHGELGFGDYLMFVRYAALVQQMGANVVLHAPAPLVGLFAALPGNVRVVQQGDAIPEVDFRCPVMSLPLACATLGESIPSVFPYLSVPAERQKTWRDRLGPAQRRRVGLVWSGKGDRGIDRNPLRRRSVPLPLLEPLLGMDFEFHSLQKDVSHEDAAILSNTPRVARHEHEIADFSDTAALVQQMDVVVSIDTSVAHLAGALDKPLCVLLPYAADYRWTAHGGATPWYPRAELAREPAPGNWTAAVEQVRAILGGKKWNRV